MNHLSDDLLLAYVRQQQLYLWSRDMQEHLANCLVCQERCAEYAWTSSTIEVWTRSSASDPAYAMVANRVMRHLHEQKPSFSQRLYHGVARVRVGLPITVMLVVLCAVLFAVGTIHTTRNPTAASKPNIRPTVHVPVQVTAIPRQPTATPVPTMRPTAIPGGSVVQVTPTPGSTATAETAGTAHIETNAPCTTAIDAIQNYLHVCGTNFTPGTTITIEYQIGSKYKRHVMQITSDGTFIDSLYVLSCKNVPTAIYVQSSANPPETAQIVKNIVFGTCQSFGN